MMVFDLQCAAHAHVFEAWFGSTRDYDAQQARKLISCPICGDDDIRKAVMAPNVAAKGNVLPAVPKQSSGHMMAPAGRAPEMKMMLAAMAKMQAAVLENSTWVGAKFADQARSMDAGEVPPASIYGQATAAEAQALLDDGIGIMPLPLPVTPPQQVN